MKLKCDITLDDYIVGLRHLIETSPAIRAQHRKQRLICLAIWELAFGTLAVLMHESTVFWGAGVIGGLFVAARHPSLQRRATMNQARRIYASSGSMFLGPRELEIEERGLHSVSKFEEKTIFWDSISDITVKPGYCIISVGGVAVVALPEERVTAGDFEAFSRELQQQWQAAKAE